MATVFALPMPVVPVTAAIRASSAPGRAVSSRTAARASSGRMTTTSVRASSTNAPQAPQQKGGRSQFRLLLAATTQATVDLQAFEAWSGRFNMIFLVGALLSEVVSGGSLFTSFAQVDVQAYGVLAAAMVVGGAGVAVASRPAAIGSRTLEELTSAWVSRSLFSRSLTTSVLLVEDDESSRKFSTVAEDLYKSVLRETLDDVIARDFFTPVGAVEEGEPAEAPATQRVPVPLHVRSVIEDLRDV